MLIVKNRKSFYFVPTCSSSYCFLCTDSCQTFPEIHLDIREDARLVFLVILQQLPVSFFLAQLAAQMSSVSANIRMIIFIASTHQGHFCWYLLEFVLRLLMPDSQGADVCKTAWSMSLLTCQLLTKCLHQFCWALRNFSKQLIYFNSTSLSLSLSFSVLGQMTSTGHRKNKTKQNLQIS